MTSKTKLDVNHQQKGRMEVFLNALNEEFKPVYFDWKSLTQSKIIVDGVKLRNTDNSLTITIIFADSYHDANAVAIANSFPSNDTARWSANGPVMYLVESPDTNKVAEVLSLFAGKE